MKLSFLNALPYGWATAPKVAVASTLSALIFAGCTNKAAPAGFERPPAPVTVAEAAMQDVPVYLDAIGKTVARETVAVQTQVSGRIMKIHFTDGANVKKGDMLFTIDTRPFEANLRQAAANVSRDSALKKQAEANLAREVAQAIMGRVRQVAPDLSIEPVSNESGLFKFSG